VINTYMKPAFSNLAVIFRRRDRDSPLCSSW
jgi:hypothetical protein